MPSEASPRKVEQLRVPKVRFVGEQDGPPERLLKDRLTHLFRHDKTVSTAYLARVDYGDGNIGVALGLRTASRVGPWRGWSGIVGAILGSRTKSDLTAQTARDVGKVFAAIFAGKEHLDILFLSDEQEAQLTQVCGAFFSRTH
jgi:hypothetical protein